MEIINTTIEKIQFLGDTKSADVMANALASACNSHHKVSLLDISCLDADNQDLVRRLCGITTEPDFSNDSQDVALHWLADKGFIET